MLAGTGTIKSVIAYSIIYYYESQIMWNSCIAPNFDNRVYAEGQNIK